MDLFTSPDVEELKRLAADRGLTAKEVSSGHWKISGCGDIVVNYWPTSKRRTAHVDGAKAGVVHCAPRDVIKLATTPLRDDQKLVKQQRREDPRHEPYESKINHPSGEPPWD